ncbi:MAG: DUF1799 domain-containing protein [Gammaproteobacteria bacterium]|nr:DUF1799 domain-containing protein [Gammaproteobacteria bacterium]
MYVDYAGIQYGKREAFEEIPNLHGAVRNLIAPSSPVDVDEANHQLIEMGLKPTFHSSKKNNPEFLVLPENWAAVNLLSLCRTQWEKIVITSMTGSQVIYSGLDYQAVNLLIDIYYPDEDKIDLFERLQILESKALSIFNEAN